MPVVTGPLTQTSPSDSYPTHDSRIGLGGLREVADTSTRNSIPTPQRREGMLVYTAADTSYWKLKPRPWNGTNTDWATANLGGGTVSGITFFDSAGSGWALTVTTNGNLVTTTTGTSGYPNTYQVTYS